MNYVMHKQGMIFLANMIAGDPRRINGMYVEYGEAAVPGKRDQEYYRLLGVGAENGYIRVPITHGYVDETGTVHFDALVTRSDVPDNNVRGVARCVTLAYLDDTTQANDILICTMALTSQVELRTDAMTTIHTSLRLGV